MFLFGFFPFHFDLSPCDALALQWFLEMATGPLQLSGPGWNLHKTKDVIFALLNDHGVTVNMAKQLLSLGLSEVITKEHVLALITAMNADIDEVNVLASSWDLLVPVAQAECGVILDVMEDPGARLALIPIWVQRVCGWGSINPLATLRSNWTRALPYHKIALLKVDSLNRDNN